MKTINYPILTYTVKPDVVLGILIGTEHSVVDKTVEKVEKSFFNYLRSKYKKSGDYFEFEIIKPSLKMIKVAIRQNEKNTSGKTFATTKQTKVQVPVIHGETSEGYFACYFPLQDGFFYYHNPKHLHSLAQYYLITNLQKNSKKHIYNIIGYENPNMTEISLKVNENRPQKWKGIQFQPTYPTLKKLTETLPLPKKIAKRNNTLPQTAWELQDEVKDLIDKIQNRNANVLIVGKQGTGKTAILQQAIREIAQTSKQRSQSKKTFWRMMPRRITASSKYLGEWQQTVDDLVKELILVNGVLCLTNIIELIRTGSSANTSVAAYMTPFVQSGNLKIIGEVSPEELESLRRLAPDFTNNFQLLILEEMPENKIMALMQQLSEYVYTNLKIKIDKKAIELSYRLLKRYSTYESFPGKGIKFFEKVLSDAQARKNAEVTQSDIIRLFSQQTGLPELLISDDHIFDKEKITKHFSQRIMGQEAAVRKISSIIKVFKAGLNNPYKPIATLLFTGPTGVGKTAMAQELANFLFGLNSKRNPLVRIDMSEFKLPSQIQRFIGSGNTPSVLTSAIRERPFAVLLLDEIEKASPIIFDALLTMFDEGIMTDKFGRQTNFRNTIIILTSNLGSTQHKTVSFLDTTTSEAKYEAAIKKYFKPEIINRLDGIITFNPLIKKHIYLITIKELSDFQKREGFKKRGLTVSFSKELVKHLAKVGFHEKYGARPLQRVIDKQVMQKMSIWLLENSNVYNKNLHLDWDKDLVVTVGKKE